MSLRADNTARPVFFSQCAAVRWCVGGDDQVCIGELFVSLTESALSSSKQDQVSLCVFDFF